MTAFAQQLLAVDRTRVDVRSGLLGLVVLAVLAAAIVVVGPVAMAAVVGALVVLAADPPPAGRSLAVALLPLVVAGALVTFLAIAIGGQAVPAAILVAAVGIVGALHEGRSRRAASRVLVATLWSIVALTLHDTGATAAAYALAFTFGALAGVAVAVAKAHKGPAEGTGDDDVEAASPLRSPLSGAAVLRGVGLGAAIWLGFTAFPDHPGWLATSALIVMRPPTGSALVTGLQRSIGTGIGVLVAVVVAGVVGANTPALVVLLLASAFLMMAFREVNYALYASFVTALVVYLQRILGEDATESGGQRLVETLIGVGIAFVVLWATAALARRRVAA